ncbi:hypothetical protein [Bradyrhizobium manausense]|uniref:Uncharacterized protein n=1 Tax=Bradyrhizobium manausense TaxID=989370 RepID=A0A0R3D6K9_9BRAD|nr:hypothetical protein [Bradyrhizobium manausense]KRQ03090.1 hypothetical protein AOQ71_30465 [Bradyrhizobium manausense]
MPSHANDNTLAPESHRAITSTHAATQPQGNVRPHRGNHWPTAARLAGDIGGKDMIAAMLGWRAFTAQPQVCVANDNFAGDDYEGTEELVPFNHDNRLLHDTADRTVALHGEGKPWAPGEERFTQGHRNAPERSVPAGTYTMNGTTLHQVDAESEMIRKVDESAARPRLGHVCARLLDMASSDATRAEIAAAVRQPDSDRIDRYVDHAIIAWMRDDAFAAQVA